MSNLLVLAGEFYHYLSTVNHFEQLETYIPYDLLTWPSLALAVAVLAGIVAFRYFVVAGGMWILFYKWNPTFLRGRQIYPQLPSTRSQKTEIKALPDIGSNKTSLSKQSLD